ncbi:MAG: discoidin domain-containing protein, partial [Planctomycetes bacterium]|nr:discoidin domain-containing protein [Planctomycetota bacterium]
LPGGLALVLDRLAGRGLHRFDLVLHPYWPLHVPYPNASPGELLVGADDPTRIAVHSEAAFTISQHDGYYHQTPRKYVRFDTPEPSETRTYLMTCQWPQGAPGKPTPIEVSAIGPGRWQVRRVSEDWRLMVRTGADADANDSTDARLVAVWDQGENGRERHALVLAGRRLGVDNRELMRATRPIYAAIEFGRPTWAHVWAAEPTQLTLFIEPGADYVYLNGRPAEVTHRGKSINVDLPAGESTLTVSEVARFIPRPRSVWCDDLPATPMATNAPAFQPGMIARSSSCFPEALQAIDGDANTAWTSLPGLPMPQWIEVDLPSARSMTFVRVDSGRPGGGHVELWDPEQGRYVSVGEFTTTVDASHATVTFAPVQTDRFRVVIDRIEPPVASAAVQSVQWGEKP